MTDTDTSYRISPALFAILAIGLTTGGSKLWRDPQTVLDVGGFAYIMIFGFFLIVLGLPILLSEIALGYGGRSPNPVKSFENLAQKSGRSANWKYTGYLGSVCALLVSSMVCAICTWGLVYAWYYFSGEFIGKTQEELGSLFFETVSPNRWTFLSACGLGLLSYWVLVQSPKIRFGLILKSMVYALLGLIFILLIYALVIGKITPVDTDSYSAYAGVNGTDLAISTFETVDFNNVTRDTFRNALYNAFNSASVGFFVMASLAASLPRNSNTFSVTTKAGLSGFFVIQLFAIALLPLMLLTSSIIMDQGSSMFFAQIPNTLMGLPGGSLIGIVTCLIMVLAMMTTFLILLEAPIIVIQDMLKTSRGKACAIGVGTMSAIALACVLNLDLLDVIDRNTSSILMPVTVLLTLIFIALRVPNHVLAEALPIKSLTKTKRSFNPLAIPGVISALGGALGFLISKVLASRLSEEQAFIPILVFATLFAISVFWDLISWCRKPADETVKPWRQSLVIFWLRGVAPVLVAIYLGLAFWEYLT